MLKKRILIIEDDEHIRAVLVYRVVHLGFEALAASDGLVGLEMVRQEFPDAVILDLKLPGLSGEEVCKAIREDRDKQFANIPIIMLTGKHSDVDRVIGMVIGANCYITKPFRMQELTEQLVKFTSR